MKNTYVTHEDYLLNKRNHNITGIPIENRIIRSNVEAALKEFKVKTSGGKIKVRGLFKTSLFGSTLGIAINFGRIYRYFIDNEAFMGIFRQNAFFSAKFY